MNSPRSLLPHLLPHSPLPDQRKPYLVRRTKHGNLLALCRTSLSMPNPAGKASSQHLKPRKPRRRPRPITRITWEQPRRASLQLLRQRNPRRRLQPLWLRRLRRNKPTNLLMERRARMLRQNEDRRKFLSRQVPRVRHQRNDPALWLRLGQ
jgi:hypothetical protein